jgi:hypothetical protein
MRAEGGTVRNAQGAGKARWPPAALPCGDGYCNAYADNRKATDHGGEPDDLPHLIDDRFPHRSARYWPADRQLNGAPSIGFPRRASRTLPPPLGRSAVPRCMRSHARSKAQGNPQGRRRRGASARQNRSRRHRIARLAEGKRACALPRRVSRVASCPFSLHRYSSAVARTSAPRARRRPCVGVCSRQSFATGRAASVACARAHGPLDIFVAAEAV